MYGTQRIGPDVRVWTDGELRTEDGDAVIGCDGWGGERYVDGVVERVLC